MAAAGTTASKSTGPNKAKPADAKNTAASKKVAFGRVLPANVPNT